MDSSKLMLSIPISLFILVINLCTVPMLGSCFDRIINFGDSISDTGNAYISSGNASTSIGALPYGMTYFQKPTGRWTNGRVIIDFVGIE